MDLPILIKIKNACPLHTQNKLELYLSEQITGIQKKIKEIYPNCSLGLSCMNIHFSYTMYRTTAVWLHTAFSLLDI